MLQFEPVPLQSALDAGAPIVQFSWGVPTKEMIAAVRAAKAKLGLRVTSAESARAALDAGADYLVSQGARKPGARAGKQRIVRGIAHCSRTSARQTGCGCWRERQ
jgi:hypothetical protein